MPFIFTMPKLSPTMEEGTIAKWHKKEGDHVEEGEVLLEVITDKATIEHNVLDSGWLRKILVKEKDTAQVNQPIAIFTVEKEESIESLLNDIQKKEKHPPSEVGTTPQESQKFSVPSSFSSEPKYTPEPTIPPAMPSSSESTPRILASPLARKIAEQQGLDLSTLKGTGPGGRIVSHDLENAQKKGWITLGKRETPMVASGTYEEIPLNPIRKVIAKRLQEAKSSIPHYYLTKTIKANAMWDLREQLKSYDISVTFNDMIIRASALALRKHPEINSGFNSVNQTIILFKTIDVSVAVSFEGGLITPIIRHADYKHLGEISSEVKILSKKAHEGKLREEEYKGGSFCISNLGMFGLDSFCAVINPPQAAILAVGAILDAPIIHNGSVVAGKILSLTLSADHRVIDGAEGAKFLQTLQTLLEKPSILIA